MALSRAEEVPLCRWHDTEFCTQLVVFGEWRHFFSFFLFFLWVIQLIANERKSQLVWVSAAAADEEEVVDLVRNRGSGQSWLIFPRLFNFYLTRGSYDFGVEKTAASWQKGVQVSVCCFLPGTRFGVHQEMVSPGWRRFFFTFYLLLNPYYWTYYPQSDSIMSVLVLMWVFPLRCAGWGRPRGWGFDSRSSFECVWVHHQGFWCVGTFRGFTTTDKSNVVYYEKQATKLISWSHLCRDVIDITCVLLIISSFLSSFFYWKYIQTAASMFNIHIL